MKKTYTVNGQQIPGEEVDFQTESENFNTYILFDGTRIKFKAVALKFIRLDAYNPEGEPLYMVQATNALVADVPEGLKRQ